MMCPPVIVPTWLWDAMERAGDEVFLFLRDSGRIVRNEEDARPPAAPSAPAPALNRAQRRRRRREDTR